MTGFFSTNNLVLFLCSSALFAIILIFLVLFNNFETARNSANLPNALALEQKIAPIEAGNSENLCLQENCAVEENCLAKCAKTIKAEFPINFSGKNALSNGLTFNLEAGSERFELKKTPDGKCENFGLYFSPIFDAGKEIAFENIEWDGIVDSNFSINTRTGNAETPDSSWNNWSANYYDGFSQKNAIDEGTARFMQFKLVFGGNGNCQKIGFVKIGEKEQIEITLLNVNNSTLPANLNEKNFKSRYGLNNHLLPQTLEQLSRSDFGWLRDDMPWQEIEPIKGKKVVPQKIDDYISSAKNYGMQILPIISYGNSWWWQSNYSEKDFAEFAAFIAQKYKFRYYEIWNEENFKRFWEPWFGEPPNPQKYAKLLKETSIKVKEVEPSAKIIMGGTAQIDIPYTETVLKNGTIDYIDGIAFHPYKSNCPIEEYYSDFLELQSIVKKYTSKDLAYWITEVGYRAKNASNQFGTDESIQAKMLARAFIFTLDLPVEKIFWYDSIDLREKNNEDNDYGLLKEDGTPKQAYLVSQRIVGLLKNGFPIEKNVNSSSIENLQTHLYSIGKKIYLSTWYYYDCKRVGGIKTVKPLKTTIKLNSSKYNMPIQINLLTGERTPMYYTKKDNEISLDTELSDMPLLIELTEQ